MKYVAPKKLKVLIILFFSTASVGIALGLSQHIFYLTTLGVINLCLGGFIGWVFFTQTPKSRDKRKE